MEHLLKMLVESVREMRKEQKYYFAHRRDGATPDKAKRLEREVDALLHMIDTYGQPKQGELL